MAPLRLSIVASPPTDTARLSACPNHDSIPAPGIGIAAMDFTSAGM